MYLYKISQHATEMIQLVSGFFIVVIFDLSLALHKFQKGDALEDGPASDPKKLALFSCMPTPVFFSYVRGIDSESRWNWSLNDKVISSFERDFP